MSLYFDKGANRSLSNLDAAGEEKFTDKQDTLVSGENIKTINGVSVLGEGNIEVGEGGTITVNQTYDPTSSYAQSGTAVADALANSMEAVSQNGTTSNCILEIPQNIKLEISGNNIIQKAGSVVALMGYDTYTTTTLANDITVEIKSWQNGLYYVLGGQTTSWVNLSQTDSGSSLPADGSTYDKFFLTTDRELYIWDNSTSSWKKYAHYGYPVAIVEVESGVLKGFAKDSKGRDMIFNGAGFIGHHAFVYPNVKGLEPYGKNEDGTLKSYLYKQQSLAIVEINPSIRVIGSNGSNSVTGWSYYHETSDINTYEWQYSGDRVYDRSTNTLYALNSSAIRHLTPVAFCSVVGNVVTDFTIRQPYEGARNLLTDDLEKEVETKQDDVTTLTGYDSTKTQTLKNVNGTLTWVDD